MLQKAFAIYFLDICLKHYFYHDDPDNCMLCKLLGKAIEVQKISLKQEKLWKDIAVNYRNMI